MKELATAINSEDLSLTADEINKKVTEFKNRLKELKISQIEVYNNRVEFVNGLINEFKGELMAENKNQGFVNLRAIHELQVGGSIQALLRDIRSTKIQLEQLQSELNAEKRKLELKKEAESKK